MAAVEPIIPALTGPRAAWLAAPLALAILGYAPALEGEFQWDDESVIVANPLVAHPSAISGRDLSPGALAGTRPITTLTFALDRRVGGTKPFGFHLVSLAVHLVATVLAYAFARATLRRAGHPRAAALALIVAGLFAVHPLQSQAVAYLSQRAESLASLLALSSLLLLLLAEDARGPNALIPWAAALVAHALGLGTKIVVVTVPAAYLLHRACIEPPTEGTERRAAWRRRFALAAPLLAMSAVVSIATVLAVRGHPDAGLDAGRLGPWRYLLTQLGVSLSYIGMLLWPAGQSIVHEVRSSPGLLDPATFGHVLAFFALVAGAVGISMWTGRRPTGAGAPAARVASFGVLWFVLVLSPTSGVVPLADVMVEHRVYLAGLGIMLALVVAADLLLSRVPARIRSGAGAAAVVAAWGALTIALHARSQVWRTEVALWRDAAAHAPGSATAHVNLGEALGEAGDAAGALTEFRLGATLESPDDPDWKRSRRGIAAALAALGHANEAKAVEERVRLEEAISHAADDPELRHRLATVLLFSGEPNAAVTQAQEAVRLRPDHAPYLDTLAEAASARGDAATALGALRRAISLDPDATERYGAFAEVAGQLGLLQEACAGWDRVIRSDSDAELRAHAQAARSQLPCPQP